ncbi:MAG TPA: 23S rRNA (adenine(2503)-C(2))-methyltransferase RlmN [Clostridiales bacterium]|nr:23S rRNA (adenine(2503)-C(2))-methyltransferase RlmN [Clostridiales bacterium]
MPDKKHLLDVTRQELEYAMAETGNKPYRAAQILQWVFKGARSYDEMTNIPASLRTWMGQQYHYPGMVIGNKLISDLDGTVKYRFDLADGNKVESVLMRYRHGNSICVSTQAGCKMGCAFCASTGIGFLRTLTPGEVVEQVLAVSAEEGERVSHVVFMGIGEPLENPETTIQALRIMNDPNGLGIGMRHISVSTCGLIPGIRRLMEEKMPVTLSISLHAPNDEIRSRLMPINKKYPMNALLAVCREYAQTTGRRVTYEYILLQGINDAPGQALELASLLKNTGSHINLIPYNPVPGSPLTGSRRETMERFHGILESKKISVTMRRTLGTDILAACGQLRRQGMS